MIRASQIDEICVRLRDARITAGLTVKAASDLTGLKRDTIYNIETGRRIGHMYTFLQLCDAYRCDPGIILSDIFADN